LQRNLNMKSRHLKRINVWFTYFCFTYFCFYSYNASAFLSSEPFDKKQPCGSPKVQIDWSGEDSICYGAEVVLKTQWANAGVSPSFIWKKGTEIVGNESTYTTTVPLYDKITVTITSDVSCPDSKTSSDEIDLRNIKVIENIHPSVKIIDNVTDAICHRDTVIFTAESQDAGNLPTYIWKVDGYTRQEGESNIFEHSNFVNNQIVSVELNTVEVCSIKDKNVFKRTPIAVKEQKTPNVEVFGNTSVVCEDSIVRFEVKSNILPSLYQWRVGGKDSVGANEAVWQSTLPVGEYVVSVLLKFNDNCVVPDSLIKETQIKVLTRNTPSIKIKDLSQQTICSGTSIEVETYERKYRGEVTYVWSINDIVQENETGWFANFTPPLGENTIKVVMKTNDACSQPDTAIATINVTVLDTLQPQVVIQGFNNPICPKAQIELFAASINGGDLPIYQWTVGSTTYPETHDSTFSIGTFNQGDVVSVKMKSSNVCVRPKSAIDSTETIIFDTIKKITARIDNFIEPICSQDIELFAKIENEEFESALATYQWFINNDSVVGDTSYKFIPIDIKNNDSVSVVITLNDSYCVESNSVKSSVKYTNLKPVNIPSNILCDCSDSIEVDSSSQMYLSPIYEKGTWSSSNEQVATIDSLTGKIIAKQQGHVIISFIDTNYCQPLVKTIYVYKNSTEDNEHNKEVEEENPSNNGKGTIWETHPNNTDKNDSLFLIPNFLIADGNNSFVISHLESYPQSILKIYNRWGSLVYESEDYKNNWNGTNNGEQLPTATYYFVLKRKQDDSYTFFKGFIHLSH